MQIEPRPALRQWAICGLGLSGPFEAHNAGPGARVALEQGGELFGHGAGQLFHIGDGDRAVIIACHVMADTNRQELNLLALFDHGNHIAQVFFQIIGGIDGQRAVIDRRTIGNHHQDFARFLADGHAAVRPFEGFAVDVFLEQPFFHHQTQDWAGRGAKGHRRICR